MKVYRPRLSHLVWGGFSLLFSLVIFLLLLLGYFVPPDGDVSEFISIIDKFACVIFFGEFVFRFFTATNKWRYLRWGWIDLIAAVPVTWFRFARLLKLVVVFRLLVVLRRFFRLRKIFALHYSPEQIAGLVLLFFVLCCSAILAMAAVLVLFFEQGHGGNIQTPFEALWWTLVTVTTVGYGDYFPVTLGGRIIAFVLMLFGIGLFSTLTVYVSSFLFRFIMQDGQNRQAVMTGEALARELTTIKLQLQTLMDLQAKQGIVLRAKKPSRREHVIMRKAPAARSGKQRRR